MNDRAYEPPFGANFEAVLAGSPAYIADRIGLREDLPGSVRAAIVTLMGFQGRENAVVITIRGTRGGPSDSDPLRNLRPSLWLELWGIDDMDRRR